MTFCGGGIPMAPWMRITLFGVQSAALTVGTILAAIVLAPAGWTLLRATPLFGLGVSLGIAAALLVCVLNLRDLLRGPDPGRPLIASWQRWVLVGAYRHRSSALFLTVAVSEAAPPCAPFWTRMPSRR